MLKNRPFLESVKSIETSKQDVYPFNIPAFKNKIDIKFNKMVRL